ncbi:snaclec subunit B-like [Siniperca chuatsi]|uniref:snaclec subunit B-like n=1 Tax=Siniperca chuatsi TaxID=119488 RepID=UPI001CE08E94|nr:snaclec subunit B-like [Siniperca chuatsi]
MTWAKAQTYCRQHYTDLSFVGSQSDQDKFLSDVGGNITKGWIGLHRDTSNIIAWKWSGGGYATYLNWDTRQPDNFGNNENSTVVLPNGKWNDYKETNSLPFYCISIWVKKTWEEALEHCREHQTDLTSLLSETEHLLALSKIQHDNITEQVWIGLRYLEGRWLWVNGDPLVYQAWPQGGAQDHQCPIWKCCGALTKEGVWENWDCKEKLNFLCN